MALTFCLATWLFHTAVPGLEPRGSPRVEALGFVDRSALASFETSGKVTIQSGAMTLDAAADDPYASAMLTFPRLSGETAYSVRAEVQLNGVQGGGRPWERARIYLTGRSRSGDLAPDRHSDLLRAQGNRNWWTVEGSLRPPNNAVEAVLVVRLHRASGQLQLRSLHVQALGEPAAYRITRQALVVAWIGWLIWGGLLVRSQVPPWILLALTVGGMLAGALFMAPHEVRQVLIGSTAELIGWHGRTGWLAKLGHFLIFATMSGVSRLALARVPWMVLLILLVLLAGVGEMVQFLAVDRSPSLRDWAINNAGVFTGFAAASLMLWLTRYFPSKYGNFFASRGSMTDSYKSKER